MGFGRGALLWILGVPLNDPVSARSAKNLKRSEGAETALRPLVDSGVRRNPGP